MEKMKMDETMIKLCTSYFELYMFLDFKLFTIDDNPRTLRQYTLKW